MASIIEERPGGPGRGAYPAEKPTPRESSESLRARIPGWGADLDPADRPSFPREQPGIETGAHWTTPEDQPETYPRERSIEHAFLTPVFGTAQPPKGVSGVIRRYSYARHSEAKFAHWALLILADRVDSIESQFTSILQLRPDNPITETGILSEVRRHGLSSRYGRNRTDVKHLWLDPILIGGPYILAGWAVLRVVRGKRRRR
ncbi:hypothetical protein [Naasia sp. SYSU D00057]|uniref:hypothetical protein n=1 Tax=Naasia sp. SYSU D00057 TaxID=2817380 RepID=UPI001FEFEE28|nr:hypothetical protein [Naasia sp. SYSU D00057]